MVAARSLYLVPWSGPARLLMSGGEIDSVVVLPDGADVVVADRRTSSIHLLQNVAETPAIRLLAAGLSGLGAIYPSADGSSILVARPRAKAVSSVDVGSGEVQNFPANAAPVELLPLLNRDTFLVT